MCGKKWQHITAMIVSVVMLIAPVQVALADSSGGYTYEVTAEGTATITGYAGPGGAVNIPSTLGGKPVTNIGDNAFKGNTTITSVVIPAGVTVVGKSAFDQCTKLTSIVFPRGMHTIGAYALYGCTSLTSVTIPDGVTQMNDGVFQGCTSLKSVVFPNGPTRISSSMFWGCTNLMNVTIPTSVTYIGGNAFWECKSLRSLAIPNSVGAIGHQAFVYCTGLTDLVIPNSVSLIEDKAFLGCTGLTSMTIPGSVRDLRWYTFWECTGLKEVIIEDGVTKIVQGMFDGCTSLESVTIPDSVTRIEPYAFRGCTSLTDVRIPHTVTGWGADAFKDCASLTDVIIPEGIRGVHGFSGCTSLKRVVLPMSVKRVGSFDGCTSLESISFPAKLEEITRGAFAGCSSLKAVYFAGDAPAIWGSGTDNMFDGTAPGFTVFFRKAAVGWPEPPIQWMGYDTEYVINRSPVLGSIVSRNVSVGSPVTFTVDAEDPDRDKLTYTFASGAPVGAKLGLDSGIFTWTPSKAQAGKVYEITIRVTDGRGGERSATGTFTVVRGPLTVTPLHGNNRYTTAIAISQKAFPSPAGAANVVLATGENWPDALGGAALAGVLDGPILLTAKASLPAEVRAEIVRLKAKKVYILGSTSAVSAAVASAVDGIAGVTIERIAGANRYDTARLMAEKTIEIRGVEYDGTAFITTGANFPDALGASPLAAAKGWPIFLSNPGQGDNAALISAMKSKGVNRALVLGDKNAVADSVKNKAAATLGMAERLAGTDRYKTAVAIATYGVNHAGLGWDYLAIAVGTNFPDALSGGVLQGRAGSVMLLTPGTALDSTVRTTLAANKASIFEVRYLGSTSAVSATVRSAVGQALK